jgi:hypothetical protein
LAVAIEMKLPEQRHPQLAALEDFEDGLRELLTNSGALLRPELGLLHWIQPEGSTFIAAVSVPNIAPSDELRPICMLTITSLLKTRPRLSDDSINICNRLVGLSALTRQVNQQQVMASSSFTIYDDPSQRAEMMYLALQAATLQRSWLSSVLSCLEIDFRKPVQYFDPVSGNEPSRWTNDELAEIYHELIEGGYRARLTKNGIVALLSKTNIRGQGSYLQVRNDIAHPLYGHGLSVTFILPEEQGVTSVDLEVRCLQWNRQEAHTILPVPSIGTWIVTQGRPQMQYLIFVPNVVHYRNIGKLVTDAAIQRWAVRLADSVREV